MLPRFSDVCVQSVIARTSTLRVLEDVESSPVIFGRASIPQRSELGERWRLRQRQQSVIRAGAFETRDHTGDDVD